MQVEKYQYRNHRDPKYAIPEYTFDQLVSFAKGEDAPFYSVFCCADDCVLLDIPYGSYRRTEVINELNKLSPSTYFICEAERPDCERYHRVVIKLKQEQQHRHSFERGAFFGLCVSLNGLFDTAIYHSDGFACMSAVGVQ